MRIGLISDIHGNFEALKAVLSELDRMQITEIYCLGDIAGYYTQVNACCDELRAREIPCVMGNHDFYLVSGGYCTRSKSVNDCIEYQRKVITEENLAWLKNLPVFRQIGPVNMVHGGWSNPVDEYVEPTEDYFSQIKGDVFVSGHTHIQSVHQFGSKKYCNPGSVGQPRDNDPRAAFAVYDGDFTLCRVEYNLQNVFDLMEKAGFNDYYYGSLKTGARYLTKLI